MPRLSNEQIIDACTVQIRADAATISRLKKDAATAARSAEINSRVAKAASAARDARPITITGREARGPFALPIAREMVKRSAGIEHHASRIEKAAAAATAPRPGDAIKQHLLGMADSLKKEHGLSDSHPAVQGLRFAADNYGTSSDPEETVAKAVAGAVAVCGRPSQRPSAGTRRGSTRPRSSPAQPAPPAARLRAGSTRAARDPGIPPARPPTRAQPTRPPRTRSRGAVLVAVHDAGPASSRSRRGRAR